MYALPWHSWLSAYHRHKQRVLFGYILVLFVCLLFLCIDFGITLWQWSRLFAHPVEQPTAAAFPITIERLPDMQTWHLFGDASVLSGPSSEIPTSQLNLQLRGIYVAMPESHSQAIIAVEGSDERLYSVGEELPGGALVYKILQDGVILQRNGRFERLTLPKEDMPFNVPISPMPFP